MSKAGLSAYRLYRFLLETPAALATASMLSRHSRHAEKAPWRNEDPIPKHRRCRAVGLPERDGMSSGSGGAGASSVRRELIAHG